MKPININPNELYDMFFNKKYSIKKIATILDCSISFIYEYLQKYNAISKRKLLAGTDKLQILQT